jgi:hypothetical protein
MLSCLDGLNFATTDQETHLFFGQIQSGKTHMLLSACYKSQQAGRLTLFLIPNLCTAWYGQLYHRIQTFNQSVDEPLLVNYVGDSTADQLQELIQIQPARVLVFLANPIQLDVVNQLAKGEFNLLIDEADQMYKQENTVFYPAFQRMMAQSKWTGIISATTYKLWFQAPIKTMFTHQLEPSPHYKGLGHFDTQLSSKKEKYVPLSKGEVHRCDASFVEWVNGLLEEAPYPYEVNGETRRMPILALYKGSDEISAHHRVQLYVKREFPQITTMTYDSKGIYIFSQALNESFLWIGDEIVKRKKDLYECKKSSLGQVLQYLKDNGGTERFPHIMIISGKLANRMFSFVSKDYEWHLTHQRLYMSPSTDCTTLLQSLRLCGVYKDNVPLTLSCSSSIYNTLAKADLFQKKMIEKAITDAPQMEWADFVREKNVEKNEIPKRKLVAGYSYNKEIGVVERFDRTELDADEEKGLALFLDKIYEKWSQRNQEDAPAYFRIIECFENEDEVEKEEIIRHARLTNFSHYTKWNLKRHNQYKLLIKTSGTKYKLHPVIEGHVLKLRQ